MRKYMITWESVTMLGTLQEMNQNEKVDGCIYFPFHTDTAKVQLESHHQMLYHDAYVPTMDIANAAIKKHMGVLDAAFHLHSLKLHIYQSCILISWFFFWVFCRKYCRKYHRNTMGKLWLCDPKRSVYDKELEIYKISVHWVNSVEMYWR